MNCKKCKWANVSSGDTVLLMDNGMVISQHGKNNVMCLCTIRKFIVQTMDLQLLCQSRFQRKAALTTGTDVCQKNGSTIDS